MTRDNDRLSDNILTIAKELANQLKVNTETRRVEWLDPSQRIESSRSGLPKGITPTFPSDQCYFENDAIILPSVLKRRLAIEELGPLIASALIFEKKKLIRIALAEAALVLAMILSVSAVIFFFQRLGPEGLILMVILSVIVGFPILMLLPLPYRMDRVSADRSASLLVGREHFLQTLEKIDSYRFPDVERLKYSQFARIRSTLPSITQRIRVVERSSGDGC